MFTVLSTALSLHCLQRGSGLAAVAASTTRYAAHDSFKFALPLLRASAAIAPNRMLAAAALVNTH